MQIIAEINLDHLDHNIKEINRVSKNKEIIAVIKSNAYGHGSIGIAKSLEKLGVRFFAVANLEEAIELRENNISSKILILGRTDEEKLSELITYDLIQTVISKEYSEFLLESNLNIKIHIKINTGMNRFGFDLTTIRNIDTVTKEIQHLYDSKTLIVDGIYTHFTDAANKKTTHNQISLFSNLILKLREKKINPKHIHCSNSIATTIYSDNTIDNIVRVGMLIYGIDQTKQIDLKPILKLKAKILNIQKIKAGQSIGYGKTFIADRNMKVATIAIGYADGLPISYSECGYVYYNNNKCKIIGRITMDYTMVDVTNLPVQIGEYVEVISSKISVERISELSKTIPYEIFTNLGSRINRKYLTQGVIDEENN